MANIFFLQFEHIMANTSLQAEWINPLRTALCVIDMQNDFASPTGLLSQFGLNMDVVKPAIDNMQTLVDCAHRNGIPVFFIGLKTRDQDDSAMWQEWMKRQGRDAKVESAICREGTAGMAFYGPQPTDKDTVIYKTRYSAFFSTRLHQQLQAMQRDTLVFCGVTTECCVESSVRDAFHYDYHAIVATDSCAAYEEELHIASLRAMEINFALLSNTQKICQLWEGTK